MNENTMLVPQMGINMEQATANCEELAKAIREITAGVLTTVNSFCRWVQRVVAEVAAQQEMETALRWASVDNRPLYNRYRHTKKKRIRKKYAKRILFMGLGAYTRANAEVCLLGVTPGFKAKTQIRAHNVHQIIEAPVEGHSKKPDETRQRIVELLGDVPRLEMFARQRADGWDAWGNEAPEA